MKDLPGVSAQPGCMHEKWMAGCARAHRSVRTTCCLCTGWVGGEDEQTGAGAKGPLLCLARPPCQILPCPRIGSLPDKLWLQPSAASQPLRLRRRQTSTGNEGTPTPHAAQGLPPPLPLRK